jgi:adenine deaminase
VTINPARQLRIDGRVGSLEPGKDADFVLWSKSPLDSTSICLQTWIDGRKYFDRDQDHERALALRKERDELIDKAQRILRTPGKSQTGDELAEASFFHVALEHRYDATDRHCLDEER